MSDYQKEMRIAHFKTTTSVTTSLTTTATPTSTTTPTTTTNASEAIKFCFDEKNCVILVGSGGSAGLLFIIIIMIIIKYFLKKSKRFCNFCLLWHAILSIPLPI